jgi:hypothetical protein
VDEIIDDAEIEFKCKGCGKKTKRSAGWAMEHGEFACECGTLIPVDPSKFSKELAKRESESDGFQGLMEKLGR